MAHDQPRRLIQTVVVGRADELILDYLATILEATKHMGDTLATISANQAQLATLGTDLVNTLDAQHKELLAAIAAQPGTVDTTAFQAIADSQRQTISAFQAAITANPDPAATPTVSGATSGTTPVPTA